MDVLVVDIDQAPLRWRGIESLAFPLMVSVRAGQDRQVGGGRASRPPFFPPCLLPFSFTSRVVFFYRFFERPFIIYPPRSSLLRGNWRCSSCANTHLLRRKTAYVGPGLTITNDLWVCCSQPMVLRFL